MQKTHAARINCPRWEKLVEKGGETVKVLLLTDRLGTGGAETHIATLALELRRKKVDVCVLSAGGRTSALLERVGIRQIRLPLLTHNPFRLLILRRRIRRLIAPKNSTFCTRTRAFLPF